MPRAKEPAESDHSAPKQSVTVSDVARLARVSVGTVSNVLNHPNKVQPSTLERVEWAMDQLGWTRNEAAFQLRAGQSSIIGGVFVEFSPHTVGLLEAIKNELAGRGLGFQVVSAASAEQQTRLLDMFAQQRVRGLLLSPTDGTTQQLHRLQQLGTPMVLLGRRDDSLRICSVTADDGQGGRAAATHLVALGHRHLVVVGGSDDNHQVRCRRAGAAAAMPAGSTLEFVDTPGYDVDAGIDAARRLLGRPADRTPTGILAINDRLALGLEHALIGAGCRVPADFSIVGYDDIETARTAPVPLTTVRNPQSEVARGAVELLLAEITSSELHEHRAVSVKPSLVERSSTARALVHR